MYNESHIFALTCSDSDCEAMIAKHNGDVKAAADEIALRDAIILAREQHVKDMDYYRTLALHFCKGDLQRTTDWLETTLYSELLNCDNRLDHLLNGGSVEDLARVLIQ